MEEKKVEPETAPNEYMVDVVFRHRPKQDKYRCARCKKLLPFTDFYALSSPSVYRPVTAYCKTCTVEAGKAYPAYSIMDSVLDWRGCVVCGTRNKCYEGLPCKSCLAKEGLRVCRCCKIPQPIANFAGRENPVCVSCQPTRQMVREAKIKSIEKTIHQECVHCGEPRAAAGEESCSGCKLVIQLEQEFSPSLNAWALRNGFQKLKSP